MLFIRSLFFSLLLICQHRLYGQTDGFVKSGDVQIYYRTYGEGESILIINGGPGMNSNGFEFLAERLSKNNKTIIYDQRGTGRSTMAAMDATSMTMKLMIDDIECLRKELKIEKLIVFGHSFGGMVASYYAANYPENITSLILSSSGGIDLDLLTYVGNSINAKLSNDELTKVRYWEKKITNGDTSYHARLQRGFALAPAYLYDKKHVPLLADRLTQGNAMINILLWEDMDRIGFDCHQQLKTFTKPVLIIQGRQDILKEETAYKSQNAFKNSKLILLDHCGHYGWLDAPVEYFSAIDTFLHSY